MANSRSVKKSFNTSAGLDASRSGLSVKACQAGKRTTTVRFGVFSSSFFPPFLFKRLGVWTLSRHLTLPLAINGEKKEEEKMIFLFLFFKSPFPSLSIGHRMTSFFFRGALRPQKLCGLLGTGGKSGIGNESPLGPPTSLFTQLLSSDDVMGTFFSFFSLSLSI